MTRPAPSDSGSARGQGARTETTVWGRVRRARGAPWFAALAVVAAALVALAAREAWVLARAPDTGLTVGAAGRVLSADERWPELAPDARVLALGGRAIADQADWMRAQRALPAGELTAAFTAADGTGVHTATAHTTPLSALHRAALWVRVLTGAALLALGLGAFVLRPGARATWLLLLLSWSAGAWLLGETVAELLMLSLVVVLPVTGSLGVHFLCAFPQPIEPVVDGRRWLALYAVPAALIAAQLATRAATGSWQGAGTGYAALHTARYAWLGACGLASVALAVYQLRRAGGADDPAALARARSVLVGIALGLTVPALWSAARHALGVGESRFAAYYNSIPVLLFVGAATYATVRHNALDIDRITAAVAGYAVTVALAGAGFAAALLGLPLVLGGDDAQRSPPILVALTATVFLASAPLYRAVRRRIDRRFFREHDASARMQRALRDLVVSMRAPRVDDSVRGGLRVLLTLHCERAELWELDDDGARFRRRLVEGAAGDGDAEPVDRDTPLGRAVRARADGGVDGVAARVLPTDAQDQLWALGLAAVTPVLAHGAAIGFVAVDRKRSGVAYSLEDHAFLSIVAGHLGLALERQRAAEVEVGRYRLERRLGVGGMAEVHLAWQLGPGGFERKVALKRPLPHLAHEPAAIEMFLDEARISAQLQHPGIARVYEVGEGADGYFLAMEFVDGPTVRAALRAAAQRGGGAPLPVALRVFRDVVRALDHAHRATDDRGRPLHLVHRDIKPGNVMLARDGAVKLADFGIARAATQVHTTQAGTARGTLAYMAPEQAAGRPVDARADVYAAATVLYELITGTRAFPTGPIPQPWRPPSGAAPPAAAELAGDDSTTSTRASTAPPPLPAGATPPQPMRARAPELPPALDALFYRAVAFDPADRHASASELLRPRRRRPRPRARRRRRGRGVASRARAVTATAHTASRSGMCRAAWWKSRSLVNSSRSCAMQRRASSASMVPS